MQAFQEFITDYWHSTDWPVAFLQLVLFALSVGSLGAALIFVLRAADRADGAAYRKIAKLSGTVASLAPLTGVLGTVLGCHRLVPAISQGRLDAVSSDLGMALGTTAVGIITALTAIVACSLLPRGEEVSNDT